MESILTSIKKMLGITEECTDFDTDIIIHINSALNVLSQLGVGPSQGFSISDKENLWKDFISEESNLEMVKSYVYIDVRLVFDPPLNSAAVEALKRKHAELEFRISVSVDPGKEEE